MRSSRNLPVIEDFQVYAPAANGEPARRRSGPAYVPSAGPRLSPRRRALSWCCRLLAAGIMIETLFFKFTGAPESVYIFSKMGMESWWRYGQGVWELLASALLLWPRFGWAGGILTLGALGGAIVSHLTVLGIAVQGDHGLLFAMANTAFLSAGVVTLLHRREIPGYETML